MVAATIRPAAKTTAPPESTLARCLRRPKTPRRANLAECSWPIWIGGDAAWIEFQPFVHALLNSYFPLLRTAPATVLVLRFTIRRIGLEELDPAQSVGRGRVVLAREQGQGLLGRLDGLGESAGRGIPDRQGVQDSRILPARKL